MIDRTLSTEPATVQIAMLFGEHWEVEPLSVVPFDAAQTCLDNNDMSSGSIDLAPLRRALGWLNEALMLWRAQADGSVLKPHLRSAVIQSFEYCYELSVRGLRRVRIERAITSDRVADQSFNELLRSAADAALIDDLVAWRAWRELRNATSHAYDETKAQRVAEQAEGFAVDAAALLAALEASV